MIIQNDNGVSRGMSQISQPVQPGRLDAGSPAAKTYGSGGDRVELSDRARALHVASDSLEKLPQVRTEKVQSLRRLVQSGKYQVPGEQIAEKLLGDGILA